MLTLLMLTLGIVATMAYSVLDDGSPIMFAIYLAGFTLLETVLIVNIQDVI